MKTTGAHAPCWCWYSSQEPQPKTRKRERERGRERENPQRSVDVNQKQAASCKPPLVSGAGAPGRTHNPNSNSQSQYKIPNLNTPHQQTTRTCMYNKKKGSKRRSEVDGNVPYATWDNAQCTMHSAGCTCMLQKPAKFRIRRSHKTGHAHGDGPCAWR